MTNFRIEVRFGVLYSLLMLLWLSLEFMIGLQDKYIPLHPYINILSFIIIPAVCIRLGLNDKLEAQDGKLTFRQAFTTAFLIIFFASILSIPCQIVFHKLINPDFFDDMTQYAIKHADNLKLDVSQARRDAEMYFNLTSYIIQSGLLTLVFGTIISLFAAWRRNTDK